MGLIQKYKSKKIYSKKIESFYYILAYKKGREKSQLTLNLFGFGLLSNMKGKIHEINISKNTHIYRKKMKNIRSLMVLYDI